MRILVLTIFNLIWNKCRALGALFFAVIDNIGCLEPFLPLWEHFWNRVSVELNCTSDLTPRLKGTWSSLLCRDRTFYDRCRSGSALQVLGDPGNLPDLIWGVPKNTLSECCWSYSAPAQSQVAGTPCVWKLIFWSFLTKTKPDQAFPSHVHGKI